MIIDLFFFSLWETGAKRWCKGTKKEFRYLKIGKDKAMDKANEYVRQFKEEHNIED